jgi:hypothetical protein
MSCIFASKFKEYDKLLFKDRNTQAKKGQKTVRGEVILFLRYRKPEPESSGFFLVK